MRRSLCVEYTTVSNYHSKGKQQSEFVGIHEISEMANVTSQAVTNWRARLPTFPQPLAELRAGPVFAREEITKWLENRRTAMETAVSTTKLELRETISRILSGHRTGMADFQKTVAILHQYFLQQDPQDVEAFFRPLWQAFSAEPLRANKQTGHYFPNVQAVVIRSCAEFGLTAELPTRVFGLLHWNRPELFEPWVDLVCRQFSYSLFHYQDRFTQAALEFVKGQVAIFIFERDTGLVRVDFPKTLIDAATDLQKTVDQIEFSRFERTLTQNSPAGRPPADGEVEELSRFFAALGFDQPVAAALRQAEAYLRLDGQFDPKHAGDLLRSCIDATHRQVVQALERETGKAYDGKDHKDGSRRAYMSRVGFISKPEEVFISAVYTLISDEATHGLIAPKETVLVLHRTVRDYLLLLARRLSNWHPGSAATP